MGLFFGGLFMPEIWNHSKKVLIVDDEESVRSLFEDVLTEEGYAVLSAEGGSQALDILKSEKIEVIFLDLKLFGINGIELCREIRRFKPSSIIYAMTGWGALYDIDECREAGFDDYFRKPITNEVLFKAVADAFEKLERWAK